MKGIKNYLDIKSIIGTCKKQKLDIYEIIFKISFFIELPLYTKIFNIFLKRFNHPHSFSLQILYPRIMRL